MSTEPRPFNPTWLTVAAIVLTGVITTSVNVAVNGREVGDVRARQEATEVRVTALERRLSDSDLNNGKALVGLQKDMETANKTLTAIQNALLGRGAATLSLSPTP
jgi:hypothetical protein